ncbi:MAG: phosphopantothenoylcysteine decarboxylase, partial [Bacteroidales bacterium]
FPGSEITILSAAVADYTPSVVSDSKMKKSDETFQLELKKTQDILQYLGQVKSDKQFLVGFALETDHALENAKKKLHNKNLDLIVLNTMEDEGAGFRHQTNKVSLIDRDETLTEFALKNKSEVAEDIADHISKRLLY